jgi:hypothetical protein
LERGFWILHCYCVLIREILCEILEPLGSNCWVLNTKKASFQSKSAVIVLVLSGSLSRVMNANVSACHGRHDIPVENWGFYCLWWHIQQLRNLTSLRISNSSKFPRTWLLFFVIANSFSSGCWFGWLPNTLLFVKILGV